MFSVNILRTFIGRMLVDSKHKNLPGQQASGSKNIEYKERYRVCLVGEPKLLSATDSSFTNFIDLLKPMTGSIYLISGNPHIASNSSQKIRFINLKLSMYLETLYQNTYRNILSPLLWLIRICVAQTEISLHLISISENVDILVFGGIHSYSLPVIIGKLMRKKIVLLTWGRRTVALRKMNGSQKGLEFMVTNILEKIALSLADQVAVDSMGTIEFLELGQYRGKMCINGAHYLDTSVFKPVKSLKTRKYLAGYIGRIAENKGVMKLVLAFSRLARTYPEAKFFIGGDGPLLEDIKKHLYADNLSDRVKLQGWIPYKEIPDYLNEIQLFIHPSCSEGLPAIVQEAMSCGAIVIATPVGGVPDLIIDKKTGFALADNFPETIVSCIEKALEHHDLNQISQQAIRLIEEEYTYGPMVEKCRNAFKKLTRS